MNTHLDERSGLVRCSVIGRATIVVISPDARGRNGVAPSCYRSQLCEQEDRDCWYARPLESAGEPFDYDAACLEVEAHGRVFERGMNPVEVIVGSGLPRDVQRAMLDELAVLPQFFIAWNCTPGEVSSALQELSE